MKLPEQKRKRKAMGQKERMAVIGKQRQSPLSSWISKQLLGQNIPKRHLDKDGKLTMMEGYPHGLLAIPSDGYAGQRILVPLDEQKGLIKSTHAKIHHQGHIQRNKRRIPGLAHRFLPTKGVSEILRVEILTCTA